MVVVVLIACSIVDSVVYEGEGAKPCRDREFVLPMRSARKIVQYQIYIHSSG
jgi:hypothetical protein